LKLALTAGYDRALHAIALAELLRRQGHHLDPVLVVNQITFTRVRQTLRQQGLTGLRHQALRLLTNASRHNKNQGPSCLERFLDNHCISERSLKQWCRKHHSTYDVVTTLNRPSAIRLVAATAPDGLIYAGGGILLQPIIDTVRGRILNAHSGPLPEIRGMNACEWSVLLGLKPTVTIHFIDRGIDTGPPIATFPVRVERGDTIERLREKCTLRGVEGIVQCLDAINRPIPSAAKVPAADLYRQCHVLAPVLRELLEARLRSGSSLDFQGRELS